MLKSIIQYEHIAEVFKKIIYYDYYTQHNSWTLRFILGI